MLSTFFCLFPMQKNGIITYYMERIEEMNTAKLTEKMIKFYDGKNRQRVGTA